MIKFEMTDTGIDGKGPVAHQELIIDNHTLYTYPVEIDYIIDSINDAFSYLSEKTRRDQVKRH